MSNLRRKLKTAFIAIGLHILKGYSKMKHKRIKKKLLEYGYKPTTIEKIIEFYTK